MKKSDQIPCEIFVQKARGINKERNRTWKSLFLIPFVLFSIVIVFDYLNDPLEHNIYSVLFDLLFCAMMSAGLYLLPIPPICVVSSKGFKVQRANFIYPVKIILFFLLAVPVLLGTRVSEVELTSSPARQILLALSLGTGAFILLLMVSLNKIRILMKEAELKDLIKTNLPSFETEGVENIDRNEWFRAGNFDVEGFRFQFEGSIEELEKNPYLEAT